MYVIKVERLVLKDVTFEAPASVGIIDAQEMNLHISSYAIRKSRL
jgi:preprotein translocase subunit SecB